MGGFYSFQLCVRTQNTANSEGQSTEWQRRCQSCCPLPCPPAVGRPQLFQSDSKRPLIPQSSPVSTQQPPFLPHQTHGQSTQESHFLNSQLKSFIFCTSQFAIIALTLLSCPIFAIWQACPLWLCCVGRGWTFLPISYAFAGGTLCTKAGQIPKTSPTILLPTPLVELTSWQSNLSISLVFSLCCFFVKIWMLGNLPAKQLFKVFSYR